MRMVEINLTEEFLLELSKNGVGAVDRRFTDAVGYLSTWGIGRRFTTVRIYGDPKRGEMTAVYSTKGGADVFVIGAVPDDNWNYSYHS